MPNALSSQATTDIATPEGAKKAAGYSSPGDPSQVGARDVDLVEFSGNSDDENRVAKDRVETENANDSGSIMASGSGGIIENPSSRKARISLEDRKFLYSNSPKKSKFQGTSLAASGTTSLFHDANSTVGKVSVDS